MTVVTNIVNNRALVTGSLLLLGGLSIYYFTSKANNNKKGSKDRDVPTLPDEKQSRKPKELNPATDDEPTAVNIENKPVSRSIETQPIDVKEEPITATENTPIDTIVTEKEIAVETTKEEVAEKEITVETTKEEVSESELIATELNETKADVIEKESVAIVTKEESVTTTAPNNNETPVVKEQVKESVDKEEEVETSTIEKTEVESLSVTDVPTATIDEPADTPYAASSADENDIGTPENEPASMPTFRSFDDIPEFIPQQKPRKRSSKKSLTRIQLIEQQRQNHTPTVSARCNHWPRCTNKHCKYWHPFKMCRAGDACYYGKKCMFVHPSDYLDQQEKKDDSDDVQQYF